MEMIPSPREGFTLIKAIAVTFKNVLIILMVFFAIVSGSLLYSPVLTGQIIRYLSQSEDRDITMGVILFLATFVTQIIRVVASSHMYFHFAVLGYNLANGLSLSVYSKSLRYPALSEKKFEISEIINYSQVDAERMTYMGYQLGTILFTPIEITVGVVLMYNLVGVAFLSGFAIMLIVMLLVFFSTKKIAKIND